MSKELILEEVLADGARPCGRLSGSEVKIGREPGEGIALNRTSVSRVHGVFQRIRNYWFYRDLGSTNGSWRNGKLIKEGHFALVRPGDYMQLADSALRLAAVEADSGAYPTFAPSTLIVFSGQQFADEFPLPEYGRALTVGGNQADLKLEGAEGDVPRLIVERRGEKVVVVPMGSGPSIQLNEHEVLETQTLADGDEIAVGHYAILFNDPRAQRQAVAQGAQLTPVNSLVSARRAGDAMGVGASGTHTASIRDWNAAAAEQAAGAGFDPNAMRAHVDDSDNQTVEKRPSGRFTFGQGGFGHRAQDDEDPEGTLAMDPAEMEARLADFHPSTRYAMQGRGAQSPLSGPEDKIILLIGFLLLVALMALVVWWMLL